MSSKRKTKERNWKAKILEFLEDNPSGYTITDIAENIESTRITVSKYLSLLEQEKKVFSKEVGVYKLYFSAERRYMALNLFQAYQKALLLGVKDQLVNEKDLKQAFKEIGFQIAESLSDKLFNQFPETLRGQINNFKDFLKYFGRVIPHLDFIHVGNLTIQEDIDIKIEKGIFKFKNTSVLDFPEELEYHFYILSGMIERSLSKVFTSKPVQCNVQSIDKLEKSLTMILERPQN
jgi:Ca2+-binding EF-hand superfamily protein